MWTPEARWTVSRDDEELAKFQFPAFGPTTYNNAVGQLMANKERRAYLPTGEQLAFLLDEAYNSEEVKNNSRAKFVREAIMQNGRLWVQNVNIWAPRNIGMYSVFDENGEGLRRKYTTEELEDRLSGGYTERRVRFSHDRKVAFAPRNTYSSGEHKEALARDGAFIAVYGPRSAEALDRVAKQFSLNPFSWIANNNSDKLIQTLSALYRNVNDNRLNANFNSDGNNRNGYVLSIALAPKIQKTMKTYKNLYNKIISPNNLFLAWQKARKGKTRKPDVIEFEKHLKANLRGLHKELKEKTYKPSPLVSFPIRDPKTRKISKSEFRDRIVHHAIVNILSQFMKESSYMIPVQTEKARETCLR